MKDYSIKDYQQILENIIRWEHAYYVMDEPVVSDYQYDQALKDLEMIENEHPEWRRSDSPTVRVGGGEFEGIRVCGSSGFTFKLGQLL